MYTIAVDSGANTGVACFDESKLLIFLRTLDFWSTITYIANTTRNHDVRVVIEMSKTNTNWQTKVSELVNMNVSSKIGGVQMRAQLLKEWCIRANVQFYTVHPIGKITASEFLELVKHIDMREKQKKTTNQHERDAFYLGHSFLKMI